MLTQSTQHLVLLQDGPLPNQPGAAGLFTAQPARLMVFQLLSYSLYLNPIEKLSKKINEQDMHLHFFPDFAALTDRVDVALLKFAARPAEILSLFGLAANTRVNALDWYHLEKKIW